MSNWVDQLISEYADQKKQLQAYRQTLDLADPTGLNESEMVGGMISDMAYALQWMRRGRRPGNLRGAEVANVYRHREILAELRPKMTDAEAYRMAMILLGLSARERQCFLLHMAHGLTQTEISERLNVSRSTVRQSIHRAKSKVQQELTG